MLIAVASPLICCASQTWYQPISFDMTRLTMPSTGLLRRDRDHRIDDDEVFGALERGVEIVADLGRREAIEEPVELAFETGRVFTRGPTRAHLGLDLGGELVNVDVVVRQDRPSECGTVSPVHPIWW